MPVQRNDKWTPTLGDGAHFFRSLMATPRLTGAVAPSGRPLARAMAMAVGQVRHGLVVELGPPALCERLRRILREPRLGVAS